jgi:hypothetical protein
LFTKDDYKNYFKQMEKIEKNMHNEAAKMAAYVQDPKLKSILEDISQEETKHLNIIRDIMRIISQAS